MEGRSSSEEKSSNSQAATPMGGKRGALLQLQKVENGESSTETSHLLTHLRSCTHGAVKGTSTQSRLTKEINGSAISGRLD